MTRSLRSLGSAQPHPPQTNEEIWKEVFFSGFFTETNVSVAMDKARQAGIEEGKRLQRELDSGSELAKRFKQAGREEGAKQRDWQIVLGMEVSEKYSEDNPNLQLTYKVLWNNLKEELRKEAKQ